MQKGSTSERVPPPANLSRIVLPFDKGRAVPSKWKDAEKWIVSPVRSEKTVAPPHRRRPKSKSGPLGPSVYLSTLSAGSGSPLCFDGGRVGGLNGSSPFLAEILRGGGGGGRFPSENAKPCILRSVSVHGWCDTVGETCTSLPASSQGEVTNGTREAGTVLSSKVLKKDMATQMSPDGSTQSSPKQSHSFSPSTSPYSIQEIESQLSNLEATNVEVEDRVIVTRWSKKHVRRSSGKHSVKIWEWKKKTMEARADNLAGSEVEQTANCISKYKREEAKITAWENLQQATAEAAIRKLEMKLEKKRSSSMDKILSRLRSAQRKAEEMRSTNNQSQQTEKRSKRSSYFRRSAQISSLSGCFTCPAL